MYKTKMWKLFSILSCYLHISLMPLEIQILIKADKMFYCRKLVIVYLYFSKVPSNNCMSYYMRWLSSNRNSFGCSVYDFISMSSAMPKACIRLVVKDLEVWMLARLMTSSNTILTEKRVTVSLSFNHFLTSKDSDISSLNLMWEFDYTMISNSS